jgi:hypothetical protein
MSTSEWHPGSLYDNINVFANSLGYENAGIAITLGMIPWESIEDRDAFIETVTGDIPKGENSTNYNIQY